MSRGQGGFSDKKKRMGKCPHAPVSWKEDGGYRSIKIVPSIKANLTVPSSG